MNAVNVVFGIIPLVITGALIHTYLEHRINWYRWIYTADPKLGRKESWRLAGQIGFNTIEIMVRNNKEKTTTVVRNNKIKDNT